MIRAHRRTRQRTGKSAQFKELKQKFVSEGKQSHLEVFSTAPADEALAALKEKLPAIQQELGVRRIVSKWDEEALNSIPESNRVDVTNRLVREFLPDQTERQRKTIDSLRNATPIPLWKAKLLYAIGAL